MTKLKNKCKKEENRGGTLTASSFSGFKLLEGMASKTPITCNNSSHAKKHIYPSLRHRLGRRIANDCMDSLKYFGRKKFLLNSPSWENEQQNQRDLLFPYLWLKTHVDHSISLVQHHIIALVKNCISAIKRTKYDHSAKWLKMPHGMLKKRTWCSPWRFSKSTISREN